VSRSVVIRVGLLLVLLVGLFAAVRLGVLPDVATLRDRIRSTGTLGWFVFVGAYAVLVLFPTPASVLTVTGGALFGVVGGSLLVLLGATLGAVLSFEIGRLLGRGAVSRFTKGRLGRVEQLLGHHGLAAVIAVRLVPVVPFMAINYGAGLSAVSRRDYVLGTTVGMVPGIVAYCAVGAYGTDPLLLAVSLAALVALVLVGGAWGRRILSRQTVVVDRGGEASGGFPG